jgi:hypothetical protein
VLRRALDAAKLGHTEKVDGFKRLDDLVRTVERQIQPKANFERVLKHERAISPALNGRTVKGQMNLF